MTIKANLADGRVLNFPDGTDPSVIQATVKRMVLGGGDQPLNQSAITNDAESKIQALQTDIDKLNQVRSNPDLLEQVFGGIEGFLALGTAIPATIASGVAGGSAALNPLASEGAGSRIQKQTQEALTFQPRLSSGKGAVENIAGAIESVSNVGTGAVAGATALTKAAINPGAINPGQIANDFTNIKDVGVGETLGQGVTDLTGSPLLGSIARVIPDAALLATGAGQFKPSSLSSKFGANIAKRGKPTAFKNLSATQKQKLIAEEIKAGNPNINSVTEFITEQGTVAVSKESRVALKALKKLGSEQSASEVVSVFERMNNASKAQVNKMLNIVKKGRDEPLFAQNNRPSDVLGESLANRAQSVATINKNAGKEIDAVAKSLKNKQVDIGGASTKFFDELKELGVTFKSGDDGFVTPNFSRSRFAGGSQKDMNVLVNDLLSETHGFEFAHGLKQEIRRNLNFDPIGTGKITGKSEKILKDLSRGIDGVLDATSDRYNIANIKFAKTKGIVDKFQKLAGKDVDLFSDTAKVTLSNKAKRITSNAQSRGVIGQDIKEIDAVLKDLGVTFKDDIQSLLFATNEMERIFNIAPQNSLGGNLLLAGGKLAKGEIPIAETVGFVKKTFSKSEQKQFLNKIKVLKDLTKLKGKK